MMDEGVLNDLLECSVCLERLDTSSRVLPCQHTFCLKCLKEIVQSHKELRCPECRVLVTVKIEELPPNVLLMRILEGLRARGVKGQRTGVEDKKSVSLPRMTHSEAVSHGGGDRQRPPHAIALYDHPHAAPGDLPFKRGDLIYLHKNIDNSWYQGECNGVTGLFHTKYVQILVELPLPTCKALYDFKMSAPDEEGCLTFEKGASITVLRRVDENWAEGKMDDKIGIFPIAFVDMNPTAKDLMKTSASLRASTTAEAIQARAHHHTQQSIRYQQMYLSSPIAAGCGTYQNLAMAYSHPIYQNNSILSKNTKITQDVIPYNQKLLQGIQGLNLRQDNPFLRQENASLRQEIPLRHDTTPQRQENTSARQENPPLRQDSVSSTVRSNLWQESSTNRAETTNLRPDSNITRPESSSTRPESSSTRPESSSTRPESSSTRLETATKRPEAVTLRHDAAKLRQNQSRTLKFDSKIFQNVVEGLQSAVEGFQTAVESFPNSVVSFNATCPSSESSSTPAVSSPNTTSSTSESTDPTSSEQLVQNPDQTSNPANNEVVQNTSTLSTECSISSNGDNTSTPSVDADSTPTQIAASPQTQSVSAVLTRNKDSRSQNKDKRHSLTPSTNKSHQTPHRHSAEILSASFLDKQSNPRQRSTRRSRSGERRHPASYVALFPYKPHKSDELELKKGAIYMVWEKCQDGWYKGSSAGGRAGVFPGNYVMATRHANRPTRPAPPQAPPRTTTDLISGPQSLPWSNTVAPSPKSTEKSKEKQSKTEKSLSPGASLMKRLAAMKSGRVPATHTTGYSVDNPVFDDAPSTSTGEMLAVHTRSGSCPTQLLQNIGTVSSSLVSGKVASRATLHGTKPQVRPSIEQAWSVVREHRKSQSLDATTTNRKTPQTNTVTVNERCRCIVPYPPNSEYELELKLGDIVRVHKKRSDGWYKGTLEKNGRAGLFPASFVESASE